MTSDPTLSRRVTRLENDTEALYQLITEVLATQKDHTRRFEQIDRRFQQVDRRFQQIDQRFQQVDRRFDRVEQRLGGIESTLVEIVRRLPEP